MRRKITRRRFLKWMLGNTVTVGLASLGCAGYVTLVEPNWLAVRRVDVPLMGLPGRFDGFTIAQLSDLHRGTLVEQDDVAWAVKKTMQLEADLVALTGDYVSGSATYATSCADALRPLAEPGPVLACLGNHDHWTDAGTVIQALTNVGITVLCNAAQEIEEGLWVAAVDDVWEEHADLNETLKDLPREATIVLLAHEPDYADEVAADGRVSLQLSGHSHGGQVRLPFFGSPVLPHLAQKYYAGSYLIGDLMLYVNRGIGLVSPPVRFNCRPEVTFLTLRSVAV